MLDAITYLSRTEVAEGKGKNIVQGSLPNNTLIMTQNKQRAIITDNQNKEEFELVLNAGDVLILHGHFYSDYTLRLARFNELAVIDLDVLLEQG